MQMNMGQKAWEKTLCLKQTVGGSCSSVQLWCYKNAFQIQKALLAQCKRNIILGGLCSQDWLLNPQNLTPYHFLLACPLLDLPFQPGILLLGCHVKATSARHCEPRGRWIPFWQSDYQHLHRIISISALGALCSGKPFRPGEIRMVGHLCQTGQL